MTSYSNERIEQLFKNSYTNNITGWNTVTHTDSCNVPIKYRSIRIGTQINCNGDLMKDHHMIEKIKQTLQKYNIKIGLIIQIDNNIEFSVELCLTENEYNQLIYYVLK
jgi:aspartokinase